ncbi:MAG: CDP-diacylglycerol--glycerol-3-phosphate 3-phosphatidyltransferase [Pseudomonadota bacterium]|jgi:CDP-diacylglycerol--glycerol-3-phosphate 3-phosphatidyltransferase
MTIKLNLPNWLTLLRICMIPVLVVVFYLPIEHARAWCGFLFALAGFTDWLDGYLARKLGMTTRFGAFLDPVADKLIVAVSLVLIVQAEPSAIIALSVAIIISREITIASLREWMAEIGERKQVAVSRLGKWKTTFQIIAITTILLALDLDREWLLPVGIFALVVSAGLTLWSMIQYLLIALPLLQHRDHNTP